jgi:Endonuclease/Exonuclease/phosphatase family
MPRFLFWNVNRSVRADEIHALAEEHAVDVILLVESPEENWDPTMSKLNEKRKRFRRHRCNARGVEVITRFPNKWITHVGDTRSTTIKRLRILNSDDFLLVVTHLASKLHQDQAGQNALAGDLATRIAKAEKTAGHRRTLVVGDFNMNPFEAPMVVCSGLHAISSRNAVSAKGSRVFNDVERHMFYNPMWRHLAGHLDTPAGTYYRSASQALEYFWHTFDQVLVRPELVERFDDSRLSVVSSVSGRSLLKANGTPDPQVGSDHLPLVFALND